MNPQAAGRRSISSSADPAAAEQNPLLIADVEYYASALNDAQRCAKSLGSVATASR
jgi:hypothetical protein